LTVVACAVLDVALAELLSLRLIDDPGECESFLGLDEDGRAPVGTFGARVQLAYLAGVIPKGLLPFFQGLKALRNAMAHRVNIHLLTPQAQKALDKLRGDLDRLGPDFVAAAHRSRTDEETARLLVLNTFAVLEHGLARQLASLRPEIRVPPHIRLHRRRHLAPSGAGTRSSRSPSATTAWRTRGAYCAGRAALPLLDLAELTGWNP